MAHGRAFLQRHWFLLALGVALLMAVASPGLAGSGGALHLDAMRSGLIAGIFLLSGLTLPGRALARAAAGWRLHVLVQGFTLGLVPLAMWLATPLWLLLLPVPLVLGLQVLACLPTTIASNVATTRAAGGDEAGALVNAVLGNLLGILVTPWTVLWLTGLWGQVDPLAVAAALGWQVALPVAVGQLLRLGLSAACDRQRARLGLLSQLALLTLVWHLVSDAAQHAHGLTASLLLVVLGVVLIWHLASTAAAYGLARWIKLPPPQRIAAAICGGQKTLAMGAPLAAILLAQAPGAALVAVPIVAHHAIQLIVGAGLAGWWRTTVVTGDPATPRPRDPATFPTDSSPAPSSHKT